MKIAVTSGKGGTGKTTVAISLALSLPKSHLLDADVEEPNCSLFLNIRTKPVAYAEIPVPVIDNEKCTHCGLCSENCEYNALANLPFQVLLFEKICHGCGVCTAICPEKAIHEEPRKIGTIYEGRKDNLRFHYGEMFVGEELATPIIKKLKEFSTSIDEGEVTIFDSPPGSACPMVETVEDADFVIVIGEPTPFGLSDMKIVIETLRKLKKPFGVIINKDGLGNDEMERYCKKECIPILMKIPFDLEIARNYSKVKPLIDLRPELKKEFREVIKKIKEMISNE